MAGGRGQGGKLTLLICRVGSRLCGLPLEHVLETMRPLPVEPLSNAASFIDGLSLIRGRPTPVIDAGRLLGESGVLAARQRYVTLQLGEHSAALAVDAVLGVRKLDETALADLPALLRESHQELVIALGTLDQQLLLVLEHSRLLPPTFWDSLAQEPPSP
jgi:purine-binding chemotaxis protein CheW